MASNNIKRFLALSLSFLMLFVCSACKEKPDDTSSQADKPQIQEEKPQTGFVFKDIDGSKMFDGDSSTYWLADTDETVVFEFSSEKEIKFNALKLIEYDTLLSDFVLEIPQNGEYTAVCRLDEMGVRTTILDEEYTAKDFRLSVTMSDPTGGIAEMEFITSEKFSGKENFINSGYFCAGSMEDLRANCYDKLYGYTDIIMFDYGSWNEKGEFLWGSMKNGIDEQHFEQTLAEVRGLPDTKDLRIWFCLQNYDKKTVKDTAVLFKTQASREKLANFAVEMCKKYNLYGIDIDYEYPGDATAWQNYDAFLSLCADKLHAAGYKLSCAFSAWGIKLSPETISKLDYVNTMTYDYFGFNDRHSPYAVCNKALTYFTGLGFKPEQLVLGIPFYKRAMEGPDHPHGQGYAETAVRWRAGLKPWVNIVTNKTWTYYFNGANMVRDKVYYALSNNFAGVFCWSMRDDTPTKNIYGVASLGQTVIDTIDHFAN